MCAQKHTAEQQLCKAVMCKAIILVNLYSNILFFFADILLKWSSAVLCYFYV